MARADLVPAADLLLHRETLTRPGDPHLAGRHAEFYQLTTARGRTSGHYVALVSDLWTRTLLA